MLLVLIRADQATFELESISPPPTAPPSLSYRFTITTPPPPPPPPPPRPPPISGVNEQTHHGALAAPLIDAGRAGKITPEDIFYNTIQPWCPRHVSHQAAFVDDLPELARAIVRESIPRIVRALPGRYPFLVPNLNGDANTVGLFRRCGQSSWNDLCSLPNATSYRR